MPVWAAQASIFGHSMGGHGALVLGLRNPARYRAISAFSPIAHPSAVPWGHKALGGYLGDDRAAWKQYDATELVRLSRSSTCCRCAMPHARAPPAPVVPCTCTRHSGR